MPSYGTASFCSPSKRVRHRCKGHRANIWRRPGAKHCSSLCSQSEGGEYCGGQARAENSTKLCPRALVMFATCSWPSLCEQSELQCWRRNRRLRGPVQISAARALPLTFDISILNAQPFRTPTYHHESIYGIVLTSPNKAGMKQNFPTPNKEDGKIRNCFKQIYFSTFLPLTR